MYSKEADIDFRSTILKTYLIYFLVNNIKSEMCLFTYCFSF